MSHLHRNLPRVSVPTKHILALQPEQLDTWAVCRFYLKWTQLSQSRNALSILRVCVLLAIRIPAIHLYPDRHMKLSSSSLAQLLVALIVQTLYLSSVPSNGKWRSTPAVLNQENHNF